MKRDFYRDKNLGFAEQWLTKANQIEASNLQQAAWLRERARRMQAHYGIAEPAAVATAERTEGAMAKSTSDPSARELEAADLARQIIASYRATL